MPGHEGGRKAAFGRTSFISFFFPEGCGSFLCVFYDKALAFRLSGLSTQKPRNTHMYTLAHIVSTRTELRERKELRVCGTIQGG